MQWIANLFRPKRKGRLDVIETFQKELEGVTLLADVEDFSLEGDVVERRVSLYAYYDGDGEYCPIVVLPVEHVRPAITLLLRAQEFMHPTKGARLPTVCMCKTQYFVDVRLRELRDVSDPNHRVPFDE